MTAAEKTSPLDLSQHLDSSYKNQVKICNWGDLLSANNKNVIWTSQGLSSVEILKKIKSERNFHLVQTDSLDPEVEVNLAAKILVSPKEFMKSPLHFILNPTGNENKEEIVYSKDFSKQEEKYKILEEIEETVIEKINSNSLIYDIQSISDELMTNAIFHAQSNIENRKKYMENGRLGNISLAVDSSRVIISCMDPHGKLVPEKLFERLYTCYTSEIAGAINQGRGGAGIGSFLVHGMSASYIVAVEENVQTVISCILPLKMSNRKRLSLSKNIHCLYVKGSQHG